MTDLIQHRGLDPIELEADPAGPESGARTAQAGPTPPTFSSSARRPAQVLLAVLAASLAACSFTAAAQSLHTSRSDAVAYALVGWAALTLGMLALIRPTRTGPGRAVSSAARRWPGSGCAQLGLATHATVSRRPDHPPGAGGGDRRPLGRAAGAPDLRPGLGHVDLGAPVGPARGRGRVVTACSPPCGTASPATVVVAGAARTPPTTTARTPNPLAAVPVPGPELRAPSPSWRRATTPRRPSWPPTCRWPPATRPLLDAQLSQAEQAAMRYPDRGQAPRPPAWSWPAAWPPASAPTTRCISADTLKGVNPDGTDQRRLPGLVDLRRHGRQRPGGRDHVRIAVRWPPTGFVGPNDHWHQHSNLCIQYTAGEIKVPFAPDSSVTPEQCASVHGQFMQQDRVDGARLGGPRLGEPAGRLLPRQPAHLLPGQHLPGRSARLLPAAVLM